MFVDIDQETGFRPALAEVKTKLTQVNFVVNPSDIGFFLRNPQEFQNLTADSSQPGGDKRQKEETLLRSFIKTARLKAGDERLLDYRYLANRWKDYLKILRGEKQCDWIKPNPKLAEGCDKSSLASVLKDDLRVFFLNNPRLGLDVTSLQYEYVVPDLPEKGIIAAGRYRFKGVIDDFRSVHQRRQAMLIEPSLPKFRNPGGELAFRLGLISCSQTLAEIDPELRIWGVGSRNCYRLVDFSREAIPEIAFHLAQAMELGYGIDLTKEDLEGQAATRRFQILTTLPQIFNGQITGRPEEIMEKAEQSYERAQILLLKMEGLKGIEGASTWERVKEIQPDSKPSKKK